MSTLDRAVKRLTLEIETLQAKMIAHQGAVDKDTHSAALYREVEETVRRASDELDTVLSDLKALKTSIDADGQESGS